MAHYVEASVVLNVSVQVDDSETEEEARERVRSSEFALLGWEDHPHSVDVAEFEITESGELSG